VRKSLYNEFNQSSNADLCYLITCLYKPDILAVKPANPARLV